MTHDESTLSGDQRVIKIDTEHFLIRLLVPVLTIGTVVVVYIGGLSLLRGLGDEGISPTCVVLPVALAVLLGGGYVIERVLKRLMPSRRSAVMTAEALTVTDARRSPPDVRRIEWHNTVNVTAWRFRVARRSRVPKGWYCMALRLLQDETELYLYAFMSQGEAERAIGYNNFVRLRPRKETQSNTDLSAVAEQRRLLKLEDARWNDGAEVQREDFHALLAMLQRRVPGW